MVQLDVGAVLAKAAALHAAAGAAPPSGLQPPTPGLVGAQGAPAAAPATGQALTAQPVLTGAAEVAGRAGGGATALVSLQSLKAAIERHFPGADPSSGVRRMTALALAQARPTAEGWDADGLGNFLKVNVDGFPAVLAATGASSYRQLMGAHPDVFVVADGPSGPSYRLGVPALLEQQQLGAPALLGWGQQPGVSGGGSSGPSGSRTAPAPAADVQVLPQQAAGAAGPSGLLPTTPSLGAPTSAPQPVRAEQGAAAAGAASAPLPEAPWGLAPLPSTAGLPPVVGPLASLEDPAFGPMLRHLAAVRVVGMDAEWGATGLSLLQLYAPGVAAQGLGEAAYLLDLSADGAGGGWPMLRALRGVLGPGGPLKVLHDCREVRGVTGQ